MAELAGQASDAPVADPLAAEQPVRCTQGVKPRVESVALELTAICNQRCDYCYNAWREDGGKSEGAAERKMLLGRVHRLLDTFVLDHVTLTGGEPLSHPAFVEVAETFRNAGVGVQVISNGTLVTEKLASKLAALRLRFVQVTLNGADEELHAAHVGKGFFRRTLQGIELLRRHRVPVVGCIVVTKKNAPHVDRILELWRSLGVRTVALSRFSPAGYASRHVAQLLPTVSDLEHAFELANPFGKQMRLQCTMPVPPCAMAVGRFPHINFGSCPIGTSRQEFSVGPGGELRNCTLHGSKIGGVQDILDGDVDLAALIKAPEVTQYRKQHPEFCEGCVHLSTCGGGCGAASQWVHQTRRTVDPLVAQHVDDTFSERLAYSRRAERTHLELVH